jgi:superfamily II DNA helicase RecQ
MLKAPLTTSRLSSEKREIQKKQLGAIQYDAEAFEKLRVWRLQTARQKGLPAYMVFSDATLQTIAAHKPHTLRELSAINGVGEKKLTLYGEAVLQALQGA